MSQTHRRFNVLIQTILELIKFFSAFFSLCYIVFAIVFRTLFFLLPTNPEVDKRVFEMSDIQFTLLLLFLSLALSWFISYRQKKLSIINPLKLDKEELLTVFIISVLSAYFFTKNFSLLSTSSNTTLIIIVLTVFFLFFFTQIIQFYTYYYPELNFRSLKHHLSTIFNIQNVKLLAHSVSIVTIVILLGGYGIFVSFLLLHQSKSYKDILKEDVFITRVVPPKTTYAYTVSLEGYNFGLVPNHRYKLYSSYGPVIIESWTNNKVEFVIPLHWPEGSVELWIERPTMRREKRIIASNIVTLTVLNRWDFFPTQNENILAKGVKKFLRVTYLEFWNNLVLKSFSPM